MLEQNIFTTILLAATIGFVPAYIWLRFWLSEDELHHEPKKTIVVSFLAGIVSVAIALVIQKTLHESGWSIFSSVTTCSFLVIAIYAAVEELAKFVMCYIGALNTKADAYPIDPVLYLITTALGFAAFENTLYIYRSLADGAVSVWGTVTLMRFIGATLVHVLSSGIIGIFLSYAFYKNPARKIEMGLLGLIIASFVHGLYNYLILSQTDLYGCTNGPSGLTTFLTLAGVWVAIILIILILEKIKHITKPKVKRS